MRLSRIFRELRLWERNKQWWFGGQRFSHKILYYPHLVITYLRLFAGTKSINYLGKKFIFDNPATPLNMQIYPYEVRHKILDNMHALPNTVLDIGGNIGQFSATLAYFLGQKAHIDVFEPNSEVFPMLQENLASFSNTHLHNYGVSGNATNKKQSLYFQPGRSAVGSLLKENAGDAAELVKTEIEVINDPTAATKRRQYDLVKVDVEGFELEVIQALKNVQTDYLFIEVSSSVRQRNYTDSTLLAAIENVLGPFELVFSNGFDGNSVAYELLMRFDSLRSGKKGRK